MYRVDVLNMESVGGMFGSASEEAAAFMIAEWAGIRAPDRTWRHAMPSIFFVCKVAVDVCPADTKQHGESPGSIRYYRLRGEKLPPHACGDNKTKGIWWYFFHYICRTDEVTKKRFYILQWNCVYPICVFFWKIAEYIFCSAQRKRYICYRIMSKRINHIGKIVMAIVRKLQFCNEYVKSAKPARFEVYGVLLLTILM